VKPLATAIDVTPALEMHALGVFALEQIALKIVV
jgi:hypothetical protein